LKSWTLEFWFRLAPVRDDRRDRHRAGYLRTRERREMQATVRAAIEKGQPLPPELGRGVVQGCPGAEDGVVGSSRHADRRHPAVRRRRRRPDRGRSGQINDNAMFGTVSGAAIPGMIGLAFIILSFFNPNKRPPQD
jgi:hypothetical protein